MSFGAFQSGMEESLTGIFGEDAIYQVAAGGEASPVSIVVERDVVLQPSSYHSSVIDTGTVIEAFVSQVGEPPRGAIFTVGATVYTVEKIENNDGQVVRVVVV